MRVKLRFSKVRNIIFVSIFAVGIFVGGYYLGVQGYKANVNKALQVNVVRSVPPDKNVDFALFWQVWDTLVSKYFDKTKIIPAELVYGAIQGMVSAVGDPYTMYLPPDQNKTVNEDLSGSFSGVGIEIGYKNTHLAVIAPLSGSPAEKAGVKAGDYIVHISDKVKGVEVDSASLDLSTAVSYIRGTPGTVVTLSIIREGSSVPLTIDLTREKINVPSVVLTWVGKDSNIARIKVSKFDSETTGEWNKTIDQFLQKKDAKGIIIDLRNNPGGYMQSAVDIASDFVPLSSTVVIQENGDSTKEEYKSKSLPRLASFSVIVLINGGSASASEILSGALRDNLKIKLVGEKSFGKGTIQEPVEIKGGSGLHVTTAKWLTPNGTWVHGVGLTPDVEVAIKDGTTDNQLEVVVKMF